MGRKIFVSYKYKDELVSKLKDNYQDEVDGELKWVKRKTRVRDYVDILQELIGADNINLGEKDGESLEDFADSTIEGKLKDKLFQSSVTIVIISKGMKDSTQKEKEQWVPWEISYSLKTVPRENQTSKMNAILVLFYLMKQEPMIGITGLIQTVTQQLISRINCLKC